MKRFQKRIVSTVVALILAFLDHSISHAQVGLDRVQRRNGTDSGEVTAMTPLGVSISKGGVSSQIPAEEIRSISFDGEPPEFNSIRRAINRKRFDAAQQALEEIDAAKLGRPHILQEFDFLAALSQGNLALAGKSDLQEAIAAVGTFLATRRTSFHVPEMIELHGDLYLATGDSEAARKKYETLAKAPAAYYKALSAFLIGQLLLREGNPQEAIDHFERALKHGAESAAAEQILTQARMQRAICLVAAGKSEEGLETIKQFILATPRDDEQRLAQGYNALGSGYLALGNPQRARDAFLHVDLLFSSASVEHAEALHQLAKIWQELNQPTRAKEALARLSEQYPMSHWSRR